MLSGPVCLACLHHSNGERPRSTHVTRRRQEHIVSESGQEISGLSSSTACCHNILVSVPSQDVDEVKLLRVYILANI